jgi:hypothetical protein
MNYWKIGIIPNVLAPPKVSREWYGEWEIEVSSKNSEKSKWVNVDISYDLNPQGFRAPDLESYLDQKISVALGCSHTFGQGLPYDWTWPGIVEKQLDHPLLNLGVCSGSSDTVARLLTNISSLYDIQTAYIFWPWKDRFEIYDSYDTLQRTSANPDFKLEWVWNTDDIMSDNRLSKNKILVELLASKFNFEIKEWSYEEVDYAIQQNKIELSYARDGVHWGYTIHQKIAKKLLTQLL